MLNGSSLAVARTSASGMLDVAEYSDGAAADAMAIGEFGIPARDAAPSEHIEIESNFLPIAIGVRAPRGQKFNHFVRRLVDLGRSESIPVFLAKHAWIVCQFMVGRRRLLARSAPRLSTRYTREYIALGLGAVQRREVFTFHHRFMLERFEDQLTRAISSESGYVLWRHDHEGSHYEIRLKIDQSLHGEGDLVLGFYDSAGARLYDLSFSFSPGHVTGCDSHPTLLVARIQGGRDLFDAIRAATKACGDILPSLLLLSAAEGVAAALSIARLGGVSSEHQLSSRWRPEGAHRFDYDGFWHEFLGERQGEWFWAPTPLHRKPIAEVAPTHRRRARRKRQFRDALATEVSRALSEGLRQFR